MQGDASPNHDFILHAVRDVTQTPAPLILDFGCGRGHFVAAARAQGLDCYGADAYPDIWGPWRDMLE
ncbi:MAG: hypothetical protein Q8K85_10030, partial [Hyphomicrobium sp.]|nr:hypothetical protein [Hyphomicrobium sp.]